MKKTSETLNNELSSERMELDELKADISSPKNIEWLIKKEYIINAKMASSNEMAIMRRYNIIWSNGKVDLMDLAETLLDFNYNNSGDRTSRKNLWKNKHYVACTQVVLNLFNKKCEVTGNYDKATQSAAEDLIKQYKHDSSFKLAADGTVPSSARNVIVNALLFPKWKKSTEITDKSQIKPDTRLAFSKTSYEPSTWIIKTLPYEAGKYYPEWTHGNTVIDGGLWGNGGNDDEW